jgi:hypothetical protein
MRKNTIVLKQPLDKAFLPLELQVKKLRLLKNVLIPATNNNLLQFKAKNKKDVYNNNYKGVASLKANYVKRLAKLPFNAKRVALELYQF